MNQQNIENQDIDRVTEIIQQYFDGLHTANLEQLRDIFHSDAYLKAPGLRRSLNEWLEQVANRDIPAELGVSYDYRIISVDVVNEQAMVKLICPLLGRTYIDFIGLLKENGKWQIVNKMYADF